MAGTKEGPPAWGLLAALLLVFALVGIAAALLLGDAPSPATGASSGEVTTGLSLQLPDTIVAVLFLGPLLVGLVCYVIRWALGSPAGSAVRVATSVAVVVVVAVLLLAVYYGTNWGGTSEVAWGSTGSGTGPRGSGGAYSNSTLGNGTNTSGNSGHNTTGNNGTSGSGGSSGPGKTGKGGGKGTGHGGNTSSNNSTSSSRVMAPRSGASYSAPNWAFLVVAALVSVSVGFYAVPGMRERSPRGGNRRIGGSGSEDGAPDGAPPRRVSLDGSVLTIKDGETPRESIVRLYGHLLDRVEEAPERLSASTAEEIQQTRLQELQVPTQSASDLTHIFEEACYSEHPIASTDADRFVATVQAIAHDLPREGAPE